jgi:hypothetical protein
MLSIDPSIKPDNSSDLYISFALEQTKYTDKFAVTNRADFKSKVINIIKDDPNIPALLGKDDLEPEELIALNTFAVMLESMGYSINYDGSPASTAALKTALADFHDNPKELIKEYSGTINEDLQKLKDVRDGKAVYISLGGKVNGKDVPLGVSRLKVRYAADPYFISTDNDNKYVLRLASGEDPLYGALVKMAETCGKTFKAGETIGAKEINELFREYGAAFIEKQNGEIQGKIDKQRALLNGADGTIKLASIQKQVVSLGADIIRASIQQSDENGNNMENSERLAGYIKKSEDSRKTALVFIESIKTLYGAKTDKEGEIVNKFDEEFKEIWKNTLQELKDRKSEDKEEASAGADKLEPSDIELAQKLKLAMDIYNKFAKATKEDIDDKMYSYLCNVLGKEKADALKSGILPDGVIPVEINEQKEYLNKLERLVDHIVDAFPNQNDKQLIEFGMNLLAKNSLRFSPSGEHLDSEIWDLYSKNLGLLLKGDLTYQNLPAGYFGKIGVAKETAYSIDGKTTEKGLLVDIYLPNDDPFIKKLYLLLANNPSIKTQFANDHLSADKPDKALSAILLGYGGQLPPGITGDISLRDYSPLEKAKQNKAIDAALANISKPAASDEQQRSLELMLNGGKQLVFTYENVPGGVKIENLKLFYFEDGILTGPIAIKDNADVVLLKAMLASRAALANEKNLSEDTKFITQLANMIKENQSAENSQSAETLAISFKLLEKVINKEKESVSKEGLKDAANFALRILNKLVDKANGEDAASAGLIKYLRSATGTGMEKEEQSILDKVVAELTATDKTNKEDVEKAKKNIAYYDVQLTKANVEYSKQIADNTEEVKKFKRKNPGVHDAEVDQYLQQLADAKEALTNEYQSKRTALQAEKVRIETQSKIQSVEIANEQLKMKERKEKVTAASALGKVIAKELIDQLVPSSDVKTNKNQILLYAEQILDQMTDNYSKVKDEALLKEGGKREYMVVNGPAAQTLVAECENGLAAYGTESRNGETATLSFNSTDDKHEYVEKYPVFSMMLYLYEQVSAPKPANADGSPIKATFFSPEYVRALARWMNKRARNSSGLKVELSTTQINTINEVADYVNSGRLCIGNNLFRVESNLGSMINFSSNKDVRYKVIVYAEDKAGKIVTDAAGNKVVDRTATDKSNQVIGMFRDLYEVLQRVTQATEAKQERQTIYDQEEAEYGWWHRQYNNYISDPVVHSLFTMPSPALKKQVEAVDNTRVIALKEILCEPELKELRKGVPFPKNGMPSHDLGMEYFEEQGSVSIGWDFIDRFINGAKPMRINGTDHAAIEGFDWLLESAFISNILGNKAESPESIGQKWAIQHPKEFLALIAQKMQEKNIIFASLYYNVNDNSSIPQIDLPIQVNGKQVKLERPVFLAKRILQNAIGQWEPGKKGYYGVPGVPLLQNKETDAALQWLKLTGAGSTTWPYALVLKGFLIENKYFIWGEGVTYKDNLKGISLKDNKVTKKIAKQAGELMLKLLNKYKDDKEEQNKLIRSLDSMDAAFKASKPSEKFAELIKYANILVKGTNTKGTDTMEDFKEYDLTYFSSWNDDVCEALRFFARFIVPVFQDESQVSEAQFNMGAALHRLTGTLSGESGKISIIHEEEPQARSYGIDSRLDDPALTRADVLREQGKDSRDQFLNLWLAMNPTIIWQTRIAPEFQIPQLLFAFAVHHNTQALKDAMELARSLENTFISFGAFMYNPIAMWKDAARNAQQGNWTVAGVDAFFGLMALSKDYELLNKARQQTVRLFTREGSVSLRYREMASSSLRPLNERPVSSGNSAARWAARAHLTTAVPVHLVSYILEGVRQIDTRNLLPWQKRFLKHYLTNEQQNIVKHWNDAQKAPDAGATQRVPAREGDARGILGNAIADKDLSSEFVVEIEGKEGIIGKKVKVVKRITLTSADILKISLAPDLESGVTAAKEAIGRGLWMPEIRKLAATLQADMNTLGLSAEKKDEILKEALTRQDISKKAKRLTRDEKLLGNLETAVVNTAPGEKEPLVFRNGDGDPGIKMRGADYINILKFQFYNIKVDVNGFRKNRVYQLAINSIKLQNPIDEVLKNYYPEGTNPMLEHPELHESLEKFKAYRDQCYDMIIKEHLPDAAQFKKFAKTHVLKAIQTARYNRLLNAGAKVSEKLSVKKAAAKVREPQPAFAADGTTQNGAAEEPVATVLDSKGKITKIKLGQAMKGGGLVGAGLGLAINMAQHAYKKDDFSSKEVWIDIAENTGVGGGTGVLWSLLPLARTFKRTGGAVIGSSIELIMAGTSNRKFFTSKNPKVREFAKLNTAWKGVKGAADGAVWMGVDGTVTSSITAATDGFGVVPAAIVGFAAASGAAAESDHVLTVAGDWISKKTGYEEKFKIDVVKEYFNKMCGIQLNVDVQKPSNALFNEEYFARMAYMLEKNGELTEGLKNSGIKEIRLDNINNFTGTILARVVEKAKGLGKVTVEITKTKEKSYDDVNKARGKISEYTIIFKNEKGAVIKKAFNYLIENEYHNPFWHTASEASQILKQQNVSLEAGDSKEIIGITSDGLADFGKILNEHGVSKLELDKTFNFEKGLIKAIEDITAQNNGAVKEVRVSKCRTAKATMIMPNGQPIGISNDNVMEISVTMPGKTDKAVKLVEIEKDGYAILPALDFSSK